MPVPEIVLNLSQNSVKAYMINDNTQRTPSITVTGNQNYGMTIELQEGVTLVNETRGNRKTGSVVVYGGDTFYLEAPLSVNGNWTSNNIQNHKYKYQPIIYKTASDSYQDLAGRYKVFVDPTSSINLNVEWLKAGTLEIKKVDEDYPNIKIAGTTFELKDKSGNTVQTKTTNDEGSITFSDVLIGEYTLIEKQSNENYILDTIERNIRIIPGMNYLTLTNKHKEGDLTVYKVDADNNKETLGAVEFDLYSHEFEKVVGTYTTDADGKIPIKSIRTGNYSLIEKKTNKWYNLSDNIELQVNWKENTEVTVENELKKSQVKVVKVDQDNHEVKLKDVAFEVLDKNGNILETIVTDEDGEAITSRYPVRDYDNLYIREILTNEKYVLDDSIHKIELKENEIVNVILENKKIKGQIKVIKTSEDDNKITGEKRGTPLSNVSFEIYDENRNYIETITTGEDGTAITNLLEKGRKYIKEVNSTQWYFLNQNEYIAEIVKDGYIIDVRITNKSENPDVDIEKDGIIQTTANEEIRYDFKIKNTGNVPLSNFTWFDYLPTDYVRISKLITGTYNQDLNYSIYYKTNKNDYRLLKANLNTNVNNYIDFSNLELEIDEYITEFKADFGKVDVGFESIINPYIFVKVNSEVQNDDVFTNNTRAEGYHKTYMVWDEDNHTTKIYKKEIEVKKLPRTGI